MVMQRLAARRVRDHTRTRQTREASGRGIPTNDGSKRLRKFMPELSELRSQEEGQGLVEYALILFLVAVVSITALAAIGGSVTDVLQTVANSLTSP